MQVVENILYSGSADTIVQSHNINTGKLVRSYTGHTMSVSGIQALGGVLVTSSLDRIIRCFDIKVWVAVETSYMRTKLTPNIKQIQTLSKRRVKRGYCGIKFY